MALRQWKVAIDEEVWAALGEQAQAEGTEKSPLIRRLIHEYLESNGWDMSPYEAMQQPARGTGRRSVVKARIAAGDDLNARQRQAVNDLPVRQQLLYWQTRAEGSEHDQALEAVKAEATA